MNEDTLVQFDQTDAKMRKIIYSIKLPEHMLFDLDSTLLNTYDCRRGKASIFIIKHMDIILCCVLTALPETL